MKYRRSLDRYALLMGILLIAGAAALIAIAAWFLQKADVSEFDQLRRTAFTLWHLLLLSLVAGFGSMAVVEVHKHLLRARGRFHLAALEDKGLDLRLVVAPGEKVTREDLVARLDTSLEHLLAQISEFSERAITVLGQTRGKEDETESGKHEAIQKFISGLGGISEETLNKLLEFRKQAAVAKGKEDWEKKKKYETLLAEDLSQVRYSVERRLDALQIDIGSRWRYRTRLSAAIGAGVIGMVALWLSERTGLQIKIGVLAATFIWGGFFSWMARDIVAVVEKWRG